MAKAVVVGSGPNGLAAAVTLAAEGLDVTVLEASDVPGGGTRTIEATLPGLLHDECSGFHPLALDTVFARRFDLTAHGVEWAWPEVQYAHPLDAGRGGAVLRSVAETADGLGPDGASYARIFGPLTRHFDAIAEEFLQPMTHVPRHPLALGRFGLQAVAPATWVARCFRTEEARALWGGVAAHAFRPLGSPMSSAIGTALGAAAHRFGWPVAVGGSASIAAAMIELLHIYGGKVETGVTVTDAAELADYDIRMLDTSPGAAADLLRGVQRPRVARAYRRFRHGPGVFQLAFAVEGGIPWSYEPASRAGTVHVAGSLAETVEAERAIERGRMPERPFVLLGQQYLADPSRSQGQIHPIDCYAHVPRGYEGDVSESIITQIERFAPGFRERIVGRSVRSPRQIAADNRNFGGGDILTGANTPRQLVFRPRATLHPYDAGAPGTYLCSAATPPGAGAHGMAGYWAARRAMTGLRH
ncbi:FAD-dependent oxidoreductase [Aeromicrobium sp. PE09-221]|uniref:phytoene desaturase family protein n=1 Tax=Aeromicrobium sp. PE09-221 TaxID=1898043 RepID=UPI000B3E4254|nr:NAD(P)/FAD-dependent oxidoreductase [Aeromicrobium sp. PE09-221]OUZ09961.1 FAD-dependent oxidoreductase [Aeromicrobium sp. PE09-221]